MWDAGKKKVRRTRQRRNRRSQVSSERREIPCFFFPSLGPAFSVLKLRNIFRMNITTRKEKIQFALQARLAEGQKNRNL